MHKAVSYIRYSTHNQDEKSVAYQREYIEKYCKSNNIELVGEYVDEAITGTTDKRDAFSALMTAVREYHEWDTVIVYDLSRFSRNIIDSVQYLHLLQTNEVSLISVTETYGNTNEGNLMRNITFVLNDYYSKNCAKVTHSGMMTKAGKALHCGGKPPLGYDLDEEGHLIINKKEAKIVKEIFDMYTLGYSYSQIAEHLNNKGYRSKSGLPFGKNSFSSILTQEKYRGVYIWNRTIEKSASGKRTSHKHKKLEDQVIIPDGCPAIISDRQFENVKNLMNRSNGKRVSPRIHYMLSGLKILKCAECGSFLVGAKNNSHGKEYKVYYCPNRKLHKCSLPQINANDLEALVSKLLVKEIYKRKDLGKIFKAARTNEKTKRLKEKLRGKHIAIANFTKALEENYNPIFVNRIKKLTEEYRSIKTRLAEEQKGKEILTLDNAKLVLKKVARYLKDSSDLEVKKYLQESIGSITVSKDDVEITYC